MITFKDNYKHTVHLTFEQPFSLTPGHVWVICRYQHKWLLTKHPLRGFEFPGGKVEHGETAEEAALREVYEETGAIVATLIYIGQYKVLQDQEIIKTIFYADIKEIEEMESYFETKGPLLLETLPAHIQAADEFSFIMKDDVLQQSLRMLQKMELI
ncbi:RNA deprotection pyrophosphohydrolase [Bacillus alkalicellulosilyticus]|uniref:RNA deprotection pyrophosphohydrolase n=1 Tax=Alkalihalobacterium alkalicellulosilyticum TaxID=1912214 RepID=UPI000996583F|nr:nucleoside triphosphatase YtkD [Bacillus alkalicellulosilyticus]